MVNIAPKVLPLLLVLICSTSLFGQYDIRLGSTEVLADSGVSISNLSVEVQSTQPGIELTGYQMLFSYDEDLIHILGADSTIDPIEPEFFNVYVSNFPAPGLPAGVCRIGSIFSFQIDTFVPTPPGDWVPLYDLLVATTYWLYMTYRKIGNIDLSNALLTGNFEHVGLTSGG